MKLPSGGGQSERIERNRIIEASDAQNHKRNRDVEIGQGRLIMTDTNGVRYEVYVDTLGALQVKTIEGQLLSSDFKVALAEAEILGTYADTVSVAATARTLLKFGKNDDVDTAWETVWNQGGDEVFTNIDTSNAIDTISSSNAGDTVGMTLVGFTGSGTGASRQYTRVTQTATLNGQNKVVLGTPLARVERVYVTSGTALAGDVYVYEDTTISAGVPTTSAPIHLLIKGSAGETQSFKCAFTTANGEYFLASAGWASVDRAATAAIDFELQFRAPGGSFRPAARLATNSTGATTVHIPFDPYVIIPPNYDVRVRAISSAVNASVEAQIQGYYAEVQ